MSVATFSIHSPWVRNTVKFVAAVSIPLGIAWAFIAAKEAADRDFAEHQEIAKKNPTASGTEVTDYELKEVDDSNVIRWQLVAKKGGSQDSKKFEVVDVKVKYFDGPNVKMQVAAPLALVDADTRFVKMMSTKGKRVSGEGEAGKSHFEAETVELDKKNQFFATGGVIIDWAQVAKVTGNEATGKMDKNGLQNVKIRGNTHAIIAVK